MSGWGEEVGGEDGRRASYIVVESARGEVYRKETDKRLAGIRQFDIPS